MTRHLSSFSSFSIEHSNFTPNSYSTAHAGATLYEILNTLLSVLYSTTYLCPDASNIAYSLSPPHRDSSPSSLKSLLLPCRNSSQVYTKYPVAPATRGGLALTLPPSLPVSGKTTIVILPVLFLSIYFVIFLNE